jgi:hypothetical protein
VLITLFVYVKLNDYLCTMKIIKHASEIYPQASPWFWSGVHVYLNNGERPIRPCENDFLMG